MIMHYWIDIVNDYEDVLLENICFNDEFMIIIDYYYNRYL